MMARQMLCRRYSALSDVYDRVVVKAHGGADMLEFQCGSGSRKALEAKLAEGEVVVDNRYSGVNFIDTYFRTGLYPNTCPFVLGQEGAGYVSATGPGVSADMLGKKVAFWGSKTGSYAGAVHLGKDDFTVLPDDADLKVAAATMLQGLTAHYLVTSLYNVTEGDKVLVHAAAGGCGLLVSQMCKNAGAVVIGTCSTEQKAELAKKIGRCDIVLSYDSFEDKVREATGEGVDVVYDGVGKDTLEGSLKSLKRRGMLASFGNASGAVPPVAPLELTKNGSLFLTRPTLKDYMATPAERELRTRAVLDGVASGTLTTHVPLTFPLSEARAAHEALEGRRTTGKVLLEI